MLAAAYVIMALGLNVVVGFAGLLDLGYVAFFAIGAHVAAYFGSAFWGMHFDFLLILVLAIVATTAAGVLIGRADAAPARRLRRHRHARVRRDHRPGHGQRPAHPALRRHAHRRPAGHLRHRQDRPAVPRARSARWTCAPGTGSRSRSSR